MSEAAVAASPASGSAAGTPTNGSGTPAGSGSPSNGASGAPATFDWNSAGLEPGDMALVNQRAWKDPAALVNSYRNLEKLTGVPAEQIIKLPKDNDPEGWNQVYKRLGRPEKASDYKLPVPEGDKGEFAKTASEWFHEAGLSQASGLKLAEKWNQFVQKQQESEITAAREESTAEVAKLKTEWGAEYQSRCQIVDRAASAFGLSDDHLAGLREVMGPKAAMELLFNIGSRIATEDSGLVGSDVTVGRMGLTPDQAQAEISRLRNDKNFAAMFSSNDPKVKAEAREKMSRLNRIAYPE